MQKSNKFVCVFFIFIELIFCIPTIFNSIDNGLSIKAINKYVYIGIIAPIILLAVYQAILKDLCEINKKELKIIMLLSISHWFIGIILCVTIIFINLGVLLFRAPFNFTFELYVMVYSLTVCFRTIGKQKDYTKTAIWISIITGISFSFGSYLSFVSYEWIR